MHVLAYNINCKYDVQFGVRQVDQRATSLSASSISVLISSFFFSTSTIVSLSLHPNIPMLVRRSRMYSCWATLIPFSLIFRFLLNCLRSRWHHQHILSKLFSSHCLCRKNIIWSNYVYWYPCLLVTFTNLSNQVLIIV